MSDKKTNLYLKKILSLSFVIFLILSLPVNPHVELANGAVPDIVTTRLKNSMVIDYNNGTSQLITPLPPRVLDSNNNYVDRIINTNGTHFNVYSEHGSFTYNKNDCTITHYQKGFNPTNTTATDNDIFIGKMFWTFGHKPTGQGWQIFDASQLDCSISTSSNSTGKYLTAIRSHSSGSELKVVLSAPLDSAYEDFFWFKMNIPAWSGDRFAPVLWLKDVNLDSIKLRNQTVNGFTQERIFDIPYGITVIDKSQLSIESFRFLKDNSGFFYDLAKAQNNFKTLMFNKTANNLDVQIGFNNNAPIMNTRDVIFQDPVYSSNNPVTDGQVTDDGNDQVCNNASTISKDTTAQDTGVLVLEDAIVADCQRAFFDFPISISVGSVITDVDFTIDIPSTNTPRNCDYISMGTTRGSDTALNIFNAITSGTVMLDNDATCTTAGDNMSVDLGLVGNSEVQTRVTAGSGFFTFGMKFDNETTNNARHQIDIDAEEDAGATPKPTIIITYTTPIPQTITADVNENDGTTALSSGSIIVTNGTAQTYSLNSTGFAIMTGLKSSTNHNFTIYDSSNFIVNRTINFQPSANETKSFDTDIFRVSCGSGNDVILKVNETNAHYKSAHSTPVCSGQTITWNATFTRLGNYMTTATNFTSTLIATILDLTNYNLNPTSFTVNGTTKTTTYSSPTINSTSFSIANGSRSVFVNFSLVLGDTVVVPGVIGGSGSSGGGGINNQVTSASNALLLNLNSKSLSHSLGEKRTYSLELLWDKTKEFSLTINSIKIGQGSFDSLSIVPELLPLTGKKIIDGKGEIFLTVDAPGDKCNEIQMTARCVYVKTYTIPVTVSVTDILGTSYPDIPAVLTISITEKFPIGLAVVVILLLAVSYPIAKIISQNSKKQSRKSPKQMQKDHQKALKKSEKMERKQAKHDMNLFKKIRKEF